MSKKEVLRIDKYDLEKYKNYSLEKILGASPFSSDNNLDEDLGDKEFYDIFFTITENFRSAKQDLLSYIDPKNINSKSLIFLHGFSGNGKTTFIKWFIWQDESSKNRFRHNYLNLETINVYNGQNPLKQCILNELIPLIGSSKHEMLVSVLNDIHDNLYVFYKYLSNEFILSLQDLEKETLNQNSIIFGLLNDINNHDSFIIYFLIYFKYSFKKDEFESHVFYFDNMDVLHLEYITKEFAKDFFLIHRDLKELTRDQSLGYKIPYTNKFTFVFCFRDSNNPQYHLHYRDNIRRRSTDLTFDIQNFCDDIISKRVDLINRISENKDRKFLSFLIRFINDEYTKKVFLPLFNYDYRKLVSVLININSVKSFIDSDLINLENVYEKSKISKYGSRGIIFYGIIKELENENYLTKLRKRLDQIPEKIGFYDPVRLILNYLLNKGEYSYNYKGTKSKLKSEDVPLSEVLTSFSHIYKKEDILDTLEKLYLFHENGWSHFITFYNFKILTEGDLGKSNENELNNTTIKVNPAGYIFLRYIITHFEYFSRQEGNKKPLFNSFEPVFLNNRMRYSFESVIDKVFERVSLCCLLMSKFYSGGLAEKCGFTNPTEYLKSDYSFKYIDEFKFKNYLDEDIEIKAISTGVFYSTRLINTHIGYLDEFRKFLFISQDFKKLHDNNKEKFPDFKTYDIPYLNRLILNRISKYVKLLEESTEESPNTHFVNAYNTCIKAIEQSRFTDTKIEVSMEYFNKNLKKSI